MTEFIEWLKGIDYTAFYAILATFVTTWGGSIIALVVGLLKQRTKNFNYQQLLENTKVQLNQQQIDTIDKLKGDIVSLLSNIENEIIANNNQANEKRIEIINNIVKEADESLEELQELSSDEVLKGLD